MAAPPPPYLDFAISTFLAQTPNANELRFKEAFASIAVALDTTTQQLIPFKNLVKIKLTQLLRMASIPPAPTPSSYLRQLLAFSRSELVSAQIKLRKLERIAHKGIVKTSLDKSGRTRGKRVNGKRVRSSLNFGVTGYNMYVKATGKMTGWKELSKCERFDYNMRAREFNIQTGVSANGQKISPNTTINPEVTTLTLT